MKVVVSKIWLAICFILFASACFAQINTVSLTSGGFASVSGQTPGTPLSTQTGAGQILAANLNFGDIGACAGQRRVRITMPIRISASTQYKIELQRSGISDGIQPKDIGFGIGNIRPQMGGNYLTGDATNLNINGTFAVNPYIAPVINGVPKYEATLADIGENPTIVLTGVPTVAKGDVGEDGNSVLVDLTFVVVPQYFTPTDLSNIMLTILISPL